MALTITKKFDELANSWVLDIVGEIDLNASPNFKSVLGQCINEKPSNIVLNCKDLTFIDSTGLGVIINTYKKINDNYTISVNQPSNSVKKLFDVTGLNKVIKLNE